MILFNMIIKDFVEKLRIFFKDYGEICVKLGYFRNEIV